ncbi:MAG: hypothetical protein AABW46_02765 [Nanoarchaeota archaeon]
MKKGKLELDKLVALLIALVLAVMILYFLKNFDTLKEALFRAIDSFK